MSLLTRDLHICVSYASVSLQATVNHFRLIKLYLSFVWPLPPSLPSAYFSSHKHNRLSIQQRRLHLKSIYRDITKAPVIAHNMCIKIVERYAVCRCIYYSHSVDACPAYGRRGHSVKTREVLVGYTCSRHSSNGSQSANQYNYPDSGYASGSRHSSGRNADGSFRR